MVEKFPVEVVPLKLVSASSQDITAFNILKVGWEMRSTYVETPHRYMVDSTEVLNPSYMGASKQTRWVTGWVHLKALIDKYTQDPFLQQYLQLGVRSTPQQVVCHMEVENEGAVMVRVVTPVKIKIRGFLHQRTQLHQV